MLKRMLNSPERITYARLREVCELHIAFNTLYGQWDRTTVDGILPNLNKEVATFWRTWLPRNSIPNDD